MKMVFLQDKNIQQRNAEIKRLFKEEKIPPVDIANKFLMSDANVYLIIQDKHYKPYDPQEYLNRKGKKKRI